LGLSETAGSPKYLHDVGDPALLFAGISGTGLTAWQRETAMLDFKKYTTGSFIKRLISVAILALLTSPSAANAEPLLIRHNAVVGSHPESEAVRHTAKRQVNISINENGDLVIQRSNISLTVASRPPKAFIEPRERIRIVQRLDYPSNSGISLKVCLQF
jgi:hypothetical protein